MQDIKNDKTLKSKTSPIFMSMSYIFSCMFKICNEFKSAFEGLLSNYEEYESRTKFYTLELDAIWEGFAWKYDGGMKEKNLQELINIRKSQGTY